MQNQIIRKLEVTSDGSHTLFIPEMDEHYHSVNGAVQESKHVFIEAGLKQVAKEKIRILEIGFGTGLNAFLTLLETETNKAREIEYYTVELYPLENELIQALNFHQVINPRKGNLYFDLHEAAWDQTIQITPSFSIHKIKGNSNTCTLPENIDLVYFDAFGPDKQPEMWNQEIFDKLFTHMNDAGILTTYCAKGSVRRMMKEAGYSVERIPGPPGKREMLRATKRLL